MSSTGSIGPALAMPMKAATSFVISPNGAHKFAYREVRSDTGETLWRWPHKPSLSEQVEAKGQLVDVTA